MAYNLRYPQVQAQNTSPAERMFTMQYGAEQKEKKQLMAKIQEYKAFPKKFAPEELQFMQLKAMEMGVPFSTDVKTSAAHKVSVAGGEFLDKLMFDLMPDSWKEAAFGRAMNETERKYVTAAGTLGLLGGFAVPFGPANIMMKGLRPKMISMLASNPKALKAVKGGMNAMGFKHIPVLKKVDKAVRVADRFKGGSKFMNVNARRAGDKGGKSIYRKGRKDDWGVSDFESEGSQVSDFVKAGQRVSKRAESGIKKSFVNPAEIGEIFNAQMLNNPAFKQAVAGARTKGEWKKAALDYFKAQGYGKNSSGNAAIKNFLNKYAGNPYSSDDLLRAANNLGGPSNAVRQFVKKGNMNTPMPPNMNVGRYNRTPGGGLNQVPMGGAGRNPNMTVMPDGQIIMGGQQPQFGGLLGGGPRLNPPQPQLGYSSGPMTLF